ncbi:MAG: guanylate kinase [Terriglobia bacterium]|jgi:guanylate kinase
MNVKRTEETPAARGSILVISAPSGAGKSTLVKRLMAASPGLSFSISYTTRPPRATEKHGRDYFFVARKVFEGMARRGEFVEWADVYGNLYGTAHKQLQAAQEAGQDILLDIDVQGHQQVRRRLPEALSVFILPPSFPELSRRLRDRRSDAPEEIERRLQTAREEIAHWPEYDYLVVNDNLENATQALRAIVLAARFRRPSQAARVEKIIGTFGGMSDGNTSEPG